MNEVDLLDIWERGVRAKRLCEAPETGLPSSIFEEERGGQGDGSTGIKGAW